MTTTTTMTTTATAAPSWLALGARVVRRLPRGKYRAMNWVCRRRSIAPFVAPLPGSSTGLVFACDVRNALAREVYFTGRYEPQETALLARLLGPGGTFADVGSHWGYFSLRAADLVGPTGRVVAVEADPRIYAILARNFELNGLARARAIHAAAAETSGTLELAGFDESQDNWGTSRVVGDGERAGGTTFAVAARPVDALLDELGIGAVDLLKMDIEGAEALALRGMGAGLAAGRYRRVLLELHPETLRNHGTDPRAVVALLADAGYRGWTIDHSTATSRRAAYGRLPRIEDALRPFHPDDPLDAWPHQLWEAPGT